jgi:drug/metabolite transporter (DMT)-like permease
MATALIASLAVFVAALAVGFAVERRVGSDAKLETLPWYLQLLVGGLAITPILHFEDRLTVGPSDGLVVAFAVSLVLWIVLPVVLSQLVNHDGTAASSEC